MACIFDCACIAFFIFIFVHRSNVCEYHMNDLVLLSMIDDIWLWFRVFNLFEIVHALLFLRLSYFFAFRD